MMEQMNISPQHVIIGVASLVVLIFLVATGILEAILLVAVAILTAIWEVIVALWSAAMEASNA